MTRGSQQALLRMLRALDKRLDKPLCLEIESGLHGTSLGGMVREASSMHWPIPLPVTRTSSEQ